MLDNWTPDTAQAFVDKLDYLNAFKLIGESEQVTLNRMIYSTNWQAAFPLRIKQLEAEALKGADVSLRLKLVKAMFEQSHVLIAHRILLDRGYFFKQLTFSDPDLQRAYFWMQENWIAIHEGSRTAMHTELFIDMPVWRQKTLIALANEGGWL